MIGICQSCFRSNDKSSSGSSSGSSVVLSNVLVVTENDANSTQGRSVFDPSVTFSAATTVVWYNNNYNKLKFKWLNK